MANFFEKMVAGIDKGVSSVKDGSKTFVDKARLNTQIQEVQKKKIAMLTNLGELIYNLQVNGVVDIEQCRGMCNEVTVFNEQIEQLQQQVEDLEAKKNVPVYAAPAPAEGGVVCPNCSAVNEPGAKFCAGCGTPMDVPAAEPVVAEEVAPVEETVAEPVESVYETPAPEVSAPICPNCETANEPGAKFCSICGTPMV